MNAQVNTQVETTKTRAAYLVKQDARKRYTFGKVWNQAVIEGTVRDTSKLLAQGVKLKVGKKSDLRRIKFDTLLAKVQKAISSTATA